MWQVGQYVTLNKEQKSKAKQHIKTFHAWHRETQLSLYVDFLKNLKPNLATDTIDPVYLDKESDKLQDLIDSAMAELLPGFVEIATTLDQEQIRELRQNLEKERQKYRDDYIDDKPENIQERRIDNIGNTVGRFFGSFNDEQKSRLKNWEQNLVSYESALLVQQEKLEENFLKSLETPNEPEKIEAAIRAMMIYRSDDWEPDLRNAIQQNKKLTYNMLAELFMSRTDKQKARTSKKIDGYVADLVALQN